jgi:hypothetical protein
MELYMAEGGLVFKIVSESEAPVITPAQRACVLHLLRNCATAIEGLTLVLEQSDEPPSPAELHGCLRGVVKTLVGMDHAFSSGSYCGLQEGDCAFVGPFVGCRDHTK